MHGSVLTNKKYIKFADDNTVEVMSMGSIDRAGDDKRIQPYKAKDGSEYLVGWPNLTLDELKKLNRSKAARYNDTGKIPYTAVIDPYTLEKMSFIGGSYGAGKLVDQVTEARKVLVKQHGKGIKRKDLRKVNKEAAKTRALLEKGELVKALKASQAQWKKLAKKPKGLQEIVAKLLEESFAAAEKQLDEIEAVIGRGEKKSAARTLMPLARVLKGTRLEERADKLLAATKSES